MLAAIGAGEPVYRWTTALNGFAAHLTAAQVQLLDQQAGRRRDRGRRGPPARRSYVDGRRPRRRHEPPPPRRGRRGDRRGRLGHLARVPRVRRGAGSRRRPAGLRRRRAPRARAGPPRTAAARSSAPAGSSTVSAPTGSAPRSRSPPSTCSATAPRSPPSPPATPASACASTAATPAGSAASPPRPASRPTRRAGARPTRPATDAPRPTWCPPSTPLSPTGSTCSASRSPAASGIDTLQRALLGAAEADIVVIGAAGNSAGAAYASHASPWVTTVGAAVGRMSRGRITVPGVRSWTGGGRPAGCGGRAVLRPGRARPRRLAPRRRPVPPRLARLPPRRRPHRGLPARRHRPHRQVRGRRPGRRPRDGPGQPATAAPSPPTSTRSPPSTSPPTPAAASAAGWPATPTPGSGCPASWATPAPGVRRRGAPPATRAAPPVKPDAVADGDAVLGALPESDRSQLGCLQRQLGRHRPCERPRRAGARRAPDWSAAVVRSLVVTARPARSPARRCWTQGAGALPGRAPTAHLALDVAARRSGAARCARTTWPTSTPARCCCPPPARPPSAPLTNVGTRAGVLLGDRPRLHHPPVRVQPLAVRLAPGESARFTITVTGPTTPGRLDDGELVWLGARGGVTRVPVALTR